MADAAECIVIGVDNSRWVPPASDIFQKQCEAIEFYCEAKFNENSDTVVGGLFAMSSYNSEHLLDFPTRSIQKIVDTFPRTSRITGCGNVDLLHTFSFGSCPFSYPLVKRYKKKRLVLFIGGLTNLSMLCVEEIGMRFRGLGIAVDVIDFYTGGPPQYPSSGYRYGRRELVALIKICNGNDNDNDNNHIVHVGSTRSIRDALSESGLLKITPCQSEEQKSEEQNVTLKRRVGIEESSAAWGIKRRAVEA